MVDLVYAPDSQEAKDAIERMKSIVPSCEGAEAIYRDPPLFTHVRVQRIEITTREVRVTVVDLGTPGFPKREARPWWTVTSAWGSHLSFSATNWHVMFANWSFYFEPQVIRSTIEAAQSAECRSREWYQRVMKALYQKEWTDPL